MRKNSKYILGVSGIGGYAHDNSMAIVREGHILFAASEERYTRIKHDSSYPAEAIKGAFKYLKIKPADIKTIAVGFPKRNLISLISNNYFYEIFSFSLSLLINRNLGIIKD